VGVAAGGVRRHWRARRIAVDCTLLGSGGENGGAKLVTLALAHALPTAAPDWEMVLLTSSAVHDELARFEGPNVRRVRVGTGRSTPSALKSRSRSYSSVLRQLVQAALPAAVSYRLRDLYRRTYVQRRHRALIDKLGCDLVLCPSTVPFIRSLTVPLVSIVYDLQHRDCPQFFTREQRFFRERQLAQACAVAARVVCISETVRERLLDAMTVVPERVVSIPLPVMHDVRTKSRTASRQLLARWELPADGFLLYPANSWPHKNHVRLLAAFERYCVEQPQSSLTLVCTGVLDDRMRSYRDGLATTAIRGRVWFTGYCPPDVLIALFQACKAVIYPSLYEGFGLPVLEAMVAGRPVLCSDLPVLREVAGSAATFFDPASTRAICGAIGTLEQRPRLVAQGVRRGLERAEQFTDRQAFARKYVELFESLLPGPLQQVSGHLALGI
jgi:glycosyltransferase involved in cell wall biosynthesis